MIHHLYAAVDLRKHPYGQLECTDCGFVWTPRNARGKPAPTDSSVNREIVQHYQKCNGRGRK